MWCHDQGKEGKDYRSLKAGDDVLTITLDRALEILAEPKSGRGRRGAAKPIRELGAHPEDDEPVNIYDGPYGPYIKHGKVNASLPEGQTVEGITIETAVEALAAKAGTKKKSGKSSKSSTSTGAKSTTKSSTAAKKTTTAKKSTTTKKSTAKKTTSSTSTKKKTGS
ncbi:topoisomerase C-terminal repeat-containing protein [Kovacikia minuta]|uniref:topoisomerase C-terminal repeat-containing protein n=1 Tax=Kovacikia minuta TaxID=2931930 RepID=UPI0036F30F5A